MSQYRRYFIPGGTYFFTVVAHGRRPILTSDIARPCLSQAIREVRTNRPFELVALVLLPDHLHTVWVLPPGDSDYPTRWKQIKEILHQILSGQRWNGRPTEMPRESVGASERSGKGGPGNTHAEDEDDVERCINYVHWNPVKHGLVKRVQDYPWSTFHRFVRRGGYDPDWGGENPCPEADLLGWEVGWCRAAIDRGEAHRNGRGFSVGLTIQWIVRHHPTPDRYLVGRRRAAIHRGEAHRYHQVPQTAAFVGWRRAAIHRGEAHRNGQGSRWASRSRRIVRHHPTRGFRA